MNTETRIFCNATNGLILSRWKMTGFQQLFDKDVDGILTDGIIVTVITRTSSVFLLNTSEIAIDFITLECVDINSRSREEKNECFSNFLVEDRAKCPIVQDIYPYPLWDKW